MVQPCDERIFCQSDPRAGELLAGSDVAFGVFDGFHRGHQLIVGQAVRAARLRGAAAVALTFDIDPDELFAQGSLKKLMTNERRLHALCEEGGVDAVVVLPFTREFASLQPHEFLGKVFASGAPASMHVGCDCRFGSKASGTVDTLRSWGGTCGMRVDALELLGAGGEPITSTRIRGLLASCDIEGANELLGACHAITAHVESGRGEGAAMGFKTANLSIAAPYRVLGDGVYGAYARIDGCRYKAAVSLGIPPTFSDIARHNCEAHILDFEGDLYGRELTLEFAHFLRPMIAFPTTEELIATVTANIDWVRANL